eukprot:1481468-Prorocentrum_lima.AAC.1
MSLARPNHSRERGPDLVQRKVPRTLRLVQDGLGGHKSACPTPRETRVANAGSAPNGKTPRGLTTATR